MTQAAQNSWTNRREGFDAWVSEPELMALLAPRSYERPAVSSGFWHGVRFAFLVIAPFCLLGIYICLR